MEPNNGGKEGRQRKGDRGRKADKMDGYMTKKDQKMERRKDGMTGKEGKRRKGTRLSARMLSMTPSTSSLFLER